MERVIQQSIRKTIKKGTEDLKAAETKETAETGEIRRQNSADVTEKRALSHRTRHFLVIFFSVVGTALAIYVAGWIMVIEPLISLWGQFQDHTVRFRDVFCVVLSVALSATAGGGIWCAFDILAGLFRDREE